MSLRNREGMTRLEVWHQRPNTKQYPYRRKDDQRHKWVYFTAPNGVRADWSHVLMLIQQHRRYRVRVKRPYYYRGGWGGYYIVQVFIGTASFLKETGK